MTIEEKGIILDIYEDLFTEKLALPWNFYDRQLMEKREILPWYVLDQVESLGKEHPKFPLIAKLFCRPAVTSGGSADCYNRQDWWMAFVKMLDDTKVYLSEEDRKELYLDLQSLIGFRLKRGEY